LEVLWTNQEERIRREKRAYQKEINLTYKYGRNDIVEKLK
jgi:hypothetical protein